MNSTIPPAVEFRHISKRFILHHERPQSFQELLVKGLRNGRAEEFWALRDVCFRLEPGEALGIIGPNGAGKSTILKLVSRILEPTSGQVIVNGRLSALLELGAGFHPDLTGRENVYLSGSVLGLSRREMNRMFAGIVEFAEMERFIDMPLKHYSAGMQMRLGFSVATSVDPDILLIDEVLAVGDEAFQKKCLARIDEFRRQNKTVILVSHSLKTIQDICRRALWLEGGEIKVIGDTNRVIALYLEEVKRREEQSLQRSNVAPRIEAKPAPPVVKAEKLPETPAAAVRPAETEKRWGSGEILITQVEMTGGNGEKRWIIESGEAITLHLHYQTGKPQSNVVFSVTIHRSDGVYVAGSNTLIAGLKLDLPAGPGVVRVHYPSVPLCRGTYFLSVGVFLEPDPPFWTHPADFHNRAYQFQVQSASAIHGLVVMPVSWQHGKLSQ